MPVAEPIAFATTGEWHDWLAAHPDATEIWVLYHRKGSGTPSIDWEQAVVEALCHGWIDGIRKTVNETQWMQRFTPRKPGSTWSLKNIGLAEKLIAEGRMAPSGRKHYQAARDSGTFDRAYSGGKDAEVPQDFLDALALASPAARNSYAGLNNRNRYAIYYRLTTAKRPETRQKRIADFIAKLAQGQSIL